MNLKTFYSKNNRPFRLSGITETECIIKWLDTGLFETFPYPKIEPYLKTKINNKYENSSKNNN